MNVEVYSWVRLKTPKKSEIQLKIGGLKLVSSKSRSTRGSNLRWKLDLGLRLLRKKKLKKIGKSRLKSRKRQKPGIWLDKGFWERFRRFWVWVSSWPYFLSSIWSFFKKRCKIPEWRLKPFLSRFAVFWHIWSSLVSPTSNLRKHIAPKSYF